MEGQHEAAKKNFWMASGLYDALKWFALIALPAIGAAYFSLAGYWNLPNPDEVVGTCAIIGTFLGALLRLSHNSYNKSDAKYDGVLQIQPDEVNETTDLTVKFNPVGLEIKDQIVLKVQRPV